MKRSEMFQAIVKHYRALSPDELASAITNAADRLCVEIHQTAYDKPTRTSKAMIAARMGKLSSLMNVVTLAYGIEADKVIEMRDTAEKELYDKAVEEKQ